MYSYFRYDEITPSGWLLKQLEIQAEGLYGKTDGEFTDGALPAAEGDERDCVPFLPDGFIPLAYLLGNDKMISRAKNYIDAVIGKQDENGRICLCKSENYNDINEVVSICKALCEYGEYAGDDIAIDAAKRALENLYIRIKSGETTLKNRDKSCWFEAFIPLIIISKKAPEPWITELALLLKKQGTDWSAQTSLWERPLNASREETDVVNIAMMLKYEALCAELLGDENKKTADRLYDILDKYNGTAVGTISGDECLSGIGANRGTALGSVVELMNTYEYLFALTGDAGWCDRLERVAFNALPAAFSDDMRSYQRDQTVNQIACVKFPGKSHFRTAGSDAHLFRETYTDCCTANFGQGWPKLAHSVFMRTAKGIVAALPLAETLETVVKGVKVKIEAVGDYPFGKSVTYKVTPEAPVKFEFSIRLPSCCRSFYKGKQVKGSFIRIEQLFEKKETIEITYKFEPVFASRTNGLKIAEYGPLVLSVPLAAKWKKTEYDMDGDTHEQPFRGYELTSADDWAFAYCSPVLAPNDYNPGKVPFSEKEPPVTVQAGVAPVDWEYEDGYTTVCGNMPVSTATKGIPREVLLVPYGCAKLRMTELPKAKG